MTLRAPRLWVAVWILGAIGWPVAFAAVLVAFVLWGQRPEVALVAIYTGLSVYPAAVGVIILRASIAYSGRKIWKALSVGIAGLMIVLGLVPVLTTKIESSASIRHIQFPSYMSGLGFRV
jgi:hypothetical protein